MEQLALIKKKFRNDGVSKADVSRLSSGQKTHAIVLSCSDSRVPPEIVFDQKLGEIFVIRTAGQSLDSSVIGSIEYAVSHLGSKLIVVMGHESCGAIKAALSTLAGVVNESWANVEGVSKDLVTRSEMLLRQEK